MPFAGYMAYILLCKQHKSGEKICYNSEDIEFFLGDCFFIGAPGIYIHIRLLKYDTILKFCESVVTCDLINNESTKSRCSKFKGQDHKFTRDFPSKKS